MSITLYGIPACDTVKKSRVWLSERGVVYGFHDYKKAGADADKIASWIATAGADRVLSRAGTTWKKLPDEAKSDLTDARIAALLVANPSAIKRPIVEHPNGLLVGFKPDEWETALAS
jgi:arsenate reductase (glutaredoxin)